MLHPSIRNLAAAALILVLTGKLGHAQSLSADPPLTRIAFGSCARQDQPQPIWDSIVAFAPQMFLFIGDTIYADTDDMALMRERYQLLLEKPGYQRLKEVCPVLATWDDHDYGRNDAGAEYAKKRESQQIFLDAFGVPQNSPRRTQEGVYHAEIFGPVGKRTQIILLDTRYFRSPLKRGAEPHEPGEGFLGPYLPVDDPAATVLGEAQWKWLEAQLRQPAELRIVTSSIQFVSDQHGWEKWANFPRERKRLLELIQKTSAKGVLLISGDRHKADLSCLRDSDIGYPLYDITSSSLNQPAKDLTQSGLRWGNEVNPHRVGLTYFEINFGTILVDWEQPDPLLRLQIRDEAGQVVIQQRVRLSELCPRPR